MLLFFRNDCKYFENDVMLGLASYWRFDQLLVVSRHTLGTCLYIYILLSTRIKVKRPNAHEALRLPYGSNLRPLAISQFHTASKFSPYHMIHGKSSNSRGGDMLASMKFWANFQCRIQNHTGVTYSFIMHRACNCLVSFVSQIASLSKFRLKSNLRTPRINAIVNSTNSSHWNLQWRHVSMSAALLTGALTYIIMSALHSACGSLSGITYSSAYYKYMTLYLW